MTDPAVEAAERACTKHGFGDIKSAREALKPIREWYENLADTYSEGCTGNALIVKRFLEDLAPLIFTTEELER